MNLKIELVTPAIANVWLNLNNTNRKLRDGVVELYAGDMKEGRWTQCAANICFYEDGDLADGQHRLWAIVESETSQTFGILRGLPRPAGLNIDTGAGRTIVDNGRISGVDTALSNEIVSVARAVAFGTSTSRQSNSEKLATIAEHREAVTWAVANGPRGKNIRNSVVTGAVARAWYVEADKEKLKRFCEILTTGFSAGEKETAPVCLRNYLLAKAGVATSSAMWCDTFFKVQFAIEKFMRGNQLTVLRPYKDECYPLKKGKVAALAAKESKAVKLSAKTAGRQIKAIK